MKKLNNKGFAISVVIYGLSVMSILILSIIMATMSSTRATTKELANDIEADLVSYSRVEVGYHVGNGQTYYVRDNQAGWYKIELWGADGGASGGLGAYTSGIVHLDDRETLEFDVPQSGGGSTRVYLSGSTNPIMIAGGGGSSEGADGGTLVGYNNDMHSIGGQINTASYVNSDFSLLEGQTLIGTKDSYATGYASASSGGYNSNGEYIGIGVGNKSYISGYGGCNPSQQGGKYFVDGMMMAGVNQGDGYAKVERVLLETQETPTLEKKNAKLNTGIKYIRDCISDSTSKWDISAMSKGEDEAALHGTTTISGKCKTVTLDKEYSLDEVAVFHDPGKDHLNHTIEVKGTTGSWMFLKNKSSLTQLSETETPAGIHISAYQFDSSEKIPDSGNYYLLPVLSENKVVTAHEDPKQSPNPIVIDYLKSKKVQKWSIEKIDKSNRNFWSTEEKNQGTIKYDEYKIVELSSYKALKVYADENKVKNQISANMAFNKYTRNDPQMWKITAVGNGTYIIESSVVIFDPSKPSGYIVPQTNIEVPDNWQDGKSELIIGRNQVTTERFKLISVDYSSKKQ